MNRAAVAAIASLLFSLALAGGTARAGSLAYVERVTGGGDPATPLPLVVAIHGLGDRPEQFAHLFDGYAEPARIVLPRAPDPWGKGFSWFPLPAGNQQAFADGVRAAADALAALITELQATLATRSATIVTGFSQGGMLSFTLAALYAERITAAVPISGLLPDAIEPHTPPRGRAPRVRALHGGADSRVPVGAARGSVERLRAAGFDAELRVYDGVGHVVSTNMREDLYRALDELARTEGTTPGPATSDRTSNPPPPREGPQRSAAPAPDRPY